MPAEYTIFWPLFNTFMFWTIIVGGFTFALLLYLIVKFRSTDEVFENPDNIQVGVFPVERHNLKLEVAWFAGPTVLVLYITWIAWQSMIAVWVDPVELKDRDQFEVHVNGVQWGWDFTYTEEITTEDGTVLSADDVSLGEVWVPCGREIKFNITTTDILHAPFIPEYGVKEDAVPLVNTYLYFTPMENGTFIMYCTEYCGDGHSVMLSDVHVVDDPNDNYECNNV